MCPAYEVPEFVPVYRPWLARSQFAIIVCAVIPLIQPTHYTDYTHAKAAFVLGEDKRSGVGCSGMIHTPASVLIVVIVIGNRNATTPR